MKGLTYIRAGYFTLITIVCLLKEENNPHNPQIRLLEEKEVVLANYNYRKEVKIPIGIEERAIAVGP
jgi:hypothetical protein